MKKNIYTALVLILFNQLLHCQETGTGDEPKMGMQDFGLTIGNMKLSDQRKYGQGTTTDKVTKTRFISIHMSESMLSNWWYEDDKTRFMFGIRECLDIGIGTSKISETTNYPGSTSTINSKKLDLIFTYEGGLGGLYRINKEMDVAFNYFFISISSFNKTSKIVKHVPQLKYRYSHYMAEITLRARTTIEFKYLPYVKDDLQTYFGLSYTFWNRTDKLTSEIVGHANFIQLTCGWQM